MSSIKGYPTEEKLESQQASHVTIEPIRTGQHGMSVLAHAATTRIAAAQVLVSADPTNKTIEVASNPARVGDILYFRSGAASGYETKVLSISGDFITYADNIPDPSAADTVDILRHKYPSVDTEGNLVINGGLITFIKDSVNTIVEEDTATPANSNPLPVSFPPGSKFEITDGTHDLDINADGSLPVTFATGAEIGITDGTDSLEINADGSINVAVAAGAEIKITDGTDDLEVNADGSINAVVSATDLDIRDLSSASDSVSVLQATHDNLNLNANLQVGDADVENGNPVPISDAGGSITVDASDLDIRDLSAAQDNVAISDGTDTLAVNADGSINSVVTATDLDIRDLDATQDNIAISDGTDTLAINADGSINVNLSSSGGTTVVDFLDTNPVLNTASTTINGSAGAFVEVVASLAAAVTRVRVADTTGEFIGVYTGASSSEALAFVINPGADGYVDVSIASATRISLRSMGSSNITVGQLYMEFVG